MKLDQKSGFGFSQRNAFLVSKGKTVPILIFICPYPSKRVKIQQSLKGTSSWRDTSTVPPPPPLPKEKRGPHSCPGCGMSLLVIIASFPDFFYKRLSLARYSKTRLVLTQSIILNRASPGIAIDENISRNLIGRELREESFI